ncbi:retron St85 family RNA-directed DNA polymerase [Providencia vermicola]|uniref:retron St85 family RNA-directed DNA polymerase n=1 Tax=Providencia vermicola TaxID=333965 RepID=UPI0032DAAE1C
MNKEIDLYSTIKSKLFLSEREMSNYFSTFPFRYKKYLIPKRNSKGSRLIAQPSRQVKNIQRESIDYMKRVLCVHDAAFAYEPDKNIKKNAIEHQGNQYILKMDFMNFFNSIKPELLLSIIEKHGLSIDKKNENLIRNIFFWKERRYSNLCLSVGAPSSPFLSNAIMYFFDLDMTSISESHDITYTRYADDLTFSSNERNILFLIPSLVRNALNKNNLKCIRINREKTIFSSKKFNRHITGVTINNNGELSLGRERKRKISAKVHHFVHEMLSPDEIERLKGELGFASYIEPNFVERLTKKYSADVILRIQKYYR